MSATAAAERRFHYAWVVAIASFVTLLGAAGFRSTPSVLIDPLRDEFGWSPLVYGWVFAGHQVGGALAAWGAGALHDVTGGYRISFVIAGVCCLIAAAGVMKIRFDPNVPAERPRDVELAPT